MRKMHLKVTANILVKANDDIESLQEIQDNLIVTTIDNEASDFDIEDTNIEKIEVIDSR
jgi:hypothetical protein